MDGRRAGGHARSDQSDGVAMCTQMTVKLPRFHLIKYQDKTFTSEKLNKGGSPLLQPAWQIPDRLLLGATVSGSAHLSFGMSLPGTSAATMRLMSDLKTMKQSPPEGVSAPRLSTMRTSMSGEAPFSDRTTRRGRAASSPCG